MRKAPVGAWPTVELRGCGRLFGFFTFKNERTGFYCAKASQYGHCTRRQGNPMLLPSFHSIGRNYPNLRFGLLPFCAEDLVLDLPSPKGSQTESGAARIQNSGYGKRNRYAIARGQLDGAVAHRIFGPAL
jgi:hypothetical protein